LLMLPEWGQAGFLVLLALIFPIGGIGFSWLMGRLGVRPERPDAIKEDTYECGVETEGSAWVQFNFRYYYFALLFVIFDVEAVFLYPWAVSTERLAVVGFVEVLTFVGILLLGLFYVWRKKALEWME
jgi:NADH:ubiquinone oxidoreductase subunit 3 (subunit A)